MNNKTTMLSSYSIIGKKIFLGFSGLILLGFIIGHMIGNLSIFAGADAINSYAYFLHKNTTLLYMTRIFLLLMLFMHIYFSISLTLTGALARERDYICKKNISATFASKTMIYSGIIILVFLVYHLLHFTFGVINPTFYGITDEKGRFDVYYMIIRNFSNGFISLIYITSLLCLGLHLSHAFFSVCQTFSIVNTHKAVHKARTVSMVASVVIIIGYILIPLTIFMEIIFI